MELYIKINTTSKRMLKGFVNTKDTREPTLLCDLCRRGNIMKTRLFHSKHNKIFFNNNIYTYMILTYIPFSMILILVGFGLYYDMVEMSNEQTRKMIDIFHKR